MSIMILTIWRMNAWEKLIPSVLQKRIGGRIANEILMSFRKQKGRENTIYLEDNIEVNNDSSNLSLKDSLQYDFDMEKRIEQQENKEKLHALIAARLSGRERQIIIMRYGLGGNMPMTQQQVSEILGISRSYVSRLETKAINTLRRNIITE